MRPHKIHVDSGGEYPGETYIYCECAYPRNGYFEGTDLPSLLAWLKEHGS